MRILQALLIVVMMFTASIASAGSKFKSYNGPEVTAILVKKSTRKMYLLNGKNILKTYNIALGPQPVGHKRFEGDGKTPEGTYIIDRRNPNSEFHLSLGVSYPNQNDVKFARKYSRSAGGDIMIHGGPRKPIKRRDWTAGCIAVTDGEIEEIYAMVKTGTIIKIIP